ncbi:MAG: hypothetical protein ACTHWH_08625 [Marinobacter sp.]
MLGFKMNQQATAQPTFSLVESYARRQHFRRMANTLLAEKDDVLADLGYERRNIVVALSLPLRSDAVEYLEQLHRAKR